MGGPQGPNNLIRGVGSRFNIYRYFATLLTGSVLFWVLNLGLLPSLGGL